MSPGRAACVELSQSEMISLSAPQRHGAPRTVMLPEQKLAGGRLDGGTRWDSRVGRGRCSRRATQISRGRTDSNEVEKRRGRRSVRTDNPHHLTCQCHPIGRASRCQGSASLFFRRATNLKRRGAFALGCFRHDRRRNENRWKLAFRTTDWLISRSFFEGHHRSCPIEHTTR